jgi:hypothetical protein
MLRDQMLAKLKNKRGESKMSPEYLDAKRSTLQNLSHEMSGMAADPLRNLKQVSVAGDSPEAIQHGLDVAKGVVDELPEGSDSEESAETPAEESAEDAGAEPLHDEDDLHQEHNQLSDEHSDLMASSQKQEMTLEDIDRKVSELVALKDQMMRAKGLV